MAFGIEGSGDDVRFGAGGGQNNWRLSGSAGYNATTAVPRASTVDFVIKVRDGAWNTAFADVYLNANANAAVEGISDFSVQINNLMNPNSLQLLTLTLTRGAGGVDETSASLSDVFSATQWTPLSSIPEPSTYAAMAGLAALLMVLRRRK